MATTQQIVKQASDAAQMISQLMTRYRGVFTIIPNSDELPLGLEINLDRLEALIELNPFEDVAPRASELGSLADYLANRPIPEPRRRTGNSVRLADWYIQKLFAERIITVVDHPYLDGHGIAEPMRSQYLFDMIVRRLHVLIPRERLGINPKTSTISFL